MVREIAESFTWAFFTKNMTYTADLVYDDLDVPETMNQPQLLEPKVQKLNKASQSVLHAFRGREKAGFLPPLILRHDERQGFYVEAACDMPELTLVAEYLG